MAARYAIVLLAAAGLLACGDDSEPRAEAEPMDASAIDAPIDVGRADAGPTIRIGCSSGGDPCSSDADCCNRLCDRSAGGSSGTCAPSRECRVTGERCGAPGITSECCSAVCLDTGDGGSATCQPLGGCRAPMDVCSTDADCCEGSCVATDLAGDGRSTMRCNSSTSCLSIGQSCGLPSSTANCCPDDSDMGPNPNCAPSAVGVPRCTGDFGAGCARAGEACTSTTECCRRSDPAIACAPAAGGTYICCLAPGEPCAFGDTCCSGVCTPNEAGDLRCASACVADGGRCTTAADCCGCACVPDAAGALRCSNDPAACGPCAGAPLGASCAMDADCCNPKLVRCAVERARPTCALRR